MKEANVVRNASRIIMTSRFLMIMIYSRNSIQYILSCQFSRKQMLVHLIKLIFITDLFYKYEYYCIPNYLLSLQPIILIVHFNIKFVKYIFYPKSVKGGQGDRSLDRFFSPKKRKKRELHRKTCMTPSRIIQFYVLIFSQLSYISQTQLKFQ